jgi:hypothetical protein
MVLVIGTKSMSAIAHGHKVKVIGLGGIQDCLQGLKAWVAYGGWGKSLMVIGVIRVIQLQMFPG